MSLKTSTHPLDQKVWKFLSERTSREQTPAGYFCDMYRHYRPGRTPKEAAEMALADFDNVRERKEAEAFAGVTYWQLAYDGAFESDEHFRR